MTDKSQILIETLKKIVIEANQISAISNADYEKQLVEKFFQTKYNLECQFDLKLENSPYNGIIELISLISIDRKTSLFKLKVLIRFISDCFIASGLIDKLNSIQIEILFKCCQVELDRHAYYFDGDANKYDSNFYLWKGTLTNLVSRFGTEDFINANTNTIQNFYEYKKLIF